MTSRLVVAPNWIGDSVMSLPVLRAIRRAHPADRLAILAPRGPAAIYRAEGSADTVLIQSSLFADVSLLRRERFDESWLLPNSFRSALAPRLAGIPARFGYSTGGRRILLTHALPEPSRTAHQLRDYDPLLLSRGIEPDRDPPRLKVPAEASEAAARGIRTGGLAARPFALLAPATAGLPEKRWPVERYADLADRLSAAGLACGAVVGPGEREIGREVASRARSAIPVLGIDLDPVGLVALLAAARVVVANDSGPMHLAAAVGTPVVALFGPTDPARTGPSGSRSRVVKKPRMNEITVEEVFEAVKEFVIGDW